MVIGEAVTLQVSRWKLTVSTMEFSYDPRYNVAYIRFQQKTHGVESLRISEELVVDMQREDVGRLVVVNEATGERTELPLAF